MEMAMQHGFIYEKLGQDPKSKITYNNVAQDLKRGDFLIRNARNVEVEVKCRKFHSDPEKGLCFLFAWTELKKFENMQKITGTDIILAVYDHNADTLIESSLVMVTVNKIRQENNRRCGWEDIHKQLIVPLSITSSGFDLLEEYRHR